MVVHNFNVETLCREKKVTIFSVAKFREPSETICMVSKYKLWFQLDTLATYRLTLQN